MRAREFFGRRCRRRRRRSRSLWSRFREDSRKKYIALGEQCTKNLDRSAFQRVAEDLILFGFRFRKGRNSKDLRHAVHAGFVARKNKRMKVTTSVAYELSKVVAFEEI